MKNTLDTFGANLEDLKEEVNEHLKILRKQLEVNRKQLEAHYEKYGDYFYRTEDSPPKTTELVMKSMLGDLRLPIKTVIETIEGVDRITKNISDSNPLSGSKSKSDAPFDPQAYLDAAARKKQIEED